MKEVFEKKTITSREFPVILLDAGGTLLHPNPPYEKVFKEVLDEKGIRRSEQEIDSAVLRVISELNELSEASDSFQLQPSLWTPMILRALHVNEQVEALAKELQLALSSKIKMVMAQSTIDICAALNQRGYRLGIVSNWNGILTDILRAYDVLDLFECILTSSEVGYAKPHQNIFEAALEDLGVQKSEVVLIGESYAADIVGARRAEFKKILYDPRFRELRALSPEDTSKKVVSIEALKHNRRLSDVRVIARFEELLEIFL